MAVCIIYSFIHPLKFQSQYQYQYQFQVQKPADSNALLHPRRQSSTTWILEEPSSILT